MAGIDQDAEKRKRLLIVGGNINQTLWKQCGSFWNFVK